MMDPTATFLIERIVSAEQARREEIVGCTEAEIQALEIIHQISLPEEYRAFLAAMGHGIGRIFNPGEGYGFYFHCVRYLNWEFRFRHELFWPLEPLPVPETAFLIGTFQSMDYWYLDLADGGDDRAVWGYGESWGSEENEPPMGRSRLASSIWELVEHELEERVAMRHRLARMQQGWFDDSAPQAGEAKNRDDLRLRCLREQWEEHLRKGETTNPESDGELPF